jgi:hypothetical protein
VNRQQQQQYTTRLLPPVVYPPASRVTQQLNNFPAPKFAASYKLHTTDTPFPQNSGPQSQARGSLRFVSRFSNRLS